MSDKLPRGHAYIRMRNGGCRLDIDYKAVDSPEADRLIQAVLAELRAINGDVGVSHQIPVDSGAKKL